MQRTEPALATLHGWVGAARCDYCVDEDALVCGWHVALSLTPVLHRRASSPRAHAGALLLLP
eukprot:12907668-Prorocentrum_lima.AAC.1